MTNGAQGRRTVKTEWRHWPTLKKIVIKTDASSVESEGCFDQVATSSGGSGLMDYLAM